uniref:C-type lectin domain-containing protein n=1 Tax=Panagrolaimus sp. ES5 TaxID=591445 RepID=A0AC34G4J1_9BILA
MSKFMNAESHCRRLIGHLASLSDAFTNAYVAQQAEKLFQGSGTSDAWLGGNNLKDPTSWTWTDNSPFAFTNWANSSGVQGNKCTAIGFANGLWMADDCFESKPYICLIDDAARTLQPT